MTLPAPAKIVEAASRRFHQTKASGKMPLPHTFPEEHLDWLHMIKDHIATSAAIEPDDFQDVPFNQRGGLAKARKLFGSELKDIIDNLNEVLVG